MGMKTRGLVGNSRNLSEAVCHRFKMIYIAVAGWAPGKGELKIKANPIMLLKTNTEKFRRGLIPLYP
jgi:hypothetical protein